MTALAGLILCFVPLFDLLAYEFSLVLALFSSLAAGHMAAAYPSRVGEQLAPYPGARWTIARLYFVCVTYGLSLLVVPLLFISLNAFRIRNCDYLEGLGFYLLGPIASVAIAAAWGLAAGLTLPSRKWASIAWVVFWLGAIGVELYDAWSTPAVRALGSFHGYFSGVLYDEDITLPFELVTLRIRDAIELLALLFTLTWLIDRSELRLAWSARRGRRKTGFAALGLVLVALGGVALESQLGHRRDAEDVAEALGGRTTSGRCVLIHPDWMSDDDANRLARDCAFRLHQVEEYLGAELEGELVVYLFSDPSEKQELIGAGHTSVAKPWRREVYIQGNRFPHPVLKHEIVHVVAGEFGSGPLRVSGKGGGILASPGLIEGVAVATDWDEPLLSPHEWSRAMHDLEVAPPLGTVLGLRFLGVNASRAYVLAGSFSRFLIDEHGAERYRRAYRISDVERAYGKSIEDLERDWLEFLDGVTLREGDLELAKARFVRPAVFEKVCAHEVAQLRERAGREESRSNWEEALRLRLLVERFSDRDAASRLDLVRTHLGAGQRERCVTILNQVIADDRSPEPYKRAASQIRADLHWSRGQRGSALKIYRALLAEPDFEPMLRMLAVKVAALENERAEPYLRRFLIGGEQLGPESSDLAMLTLAELTAAQPSLGLAHYLLGRQLFFRDEHERALAYLGRARRLGLPTAPLRVENLRMLAISRYHMGRLEGAVEVFRTLADDDSRPAGARAMAEDWIERCEWEMELRERDDA